MTAPFGDLYSKYYDLIYSDKNYEKECDYLESLFAKHSGPRTKNILELGAGTGGYAISLAARGYSVHATDISASMLRIANAKARKRHLVESFSTEVSDMRNIRSSTTFDACICMFAVIDYLPSLKDMEMAFKSVWGKLKPGGLFIFDFWNGDAVLNLGPSQRFKVVKEGRTTLIRLASPSLDEKTKSCTVHFTTFVIEAASLKHEFSENHRMRFLFPTEVKKLLRSSGFELLSLHPFLGPEKPVSNSDWNVTAVAAKTAKSP